MTTVAPTPAQVHVTPERIMQFAWGYSIPLVLEAAIRHRVFDVLDSGPMNLDALAQATGASRRGLAAIANVLVGLDFLSKDAQENFALTAESPAFLCHHQAPLHGWNHPPHQRAASPSWLKLNEVVATGKPVTSVNEEKQGGAFFHDFVLDIFPMSYAPAQALAAHMDYASAGPVSVLDLAAGSGVWGIAQAQAGPDVRVTALDWPEVIDITKKTVAKFGLTDRYTFVEGDLAWPTSAPGHNLATLGHILHSEGIDRSRALIAKTFAALAPPAAPSPSRSSPSTLIAPAPLTASSSPSTCCSEHLDVGDTFSFEEISQGGSSRPASARPRTLAAPGPSPVPPRHQTVSSSR